MKTKPPTTRRRFRSVWDEITYLHDKVLFWFYRHGNQRRALRFAERLELLLRQADPHHEAILGEECWSLVREVEGDLRGAIAYRKREIALMKRLHAISAKTPGRAFALQSRGYDCLTDRLDLLAILYFESGDVDAAIKVLLESKALCQAHGIPFDGQDVLEEYRQAKTDRESGKSNGRPHKRVRELA